MKEGLQQLFLRHAEKSGQVGHLKDVRLMTALLPIPDRGPTGHFEVSLLPEIVGNVLKSQSGRFPYFLKSFHLVTFSDPYGNQNLPGCQESLYRVGL